MAEFDADKYLAGNTAVDEFDPDAYLGVKPSAFDPDEYLKDSGQGAAFQAADEQQAMERKAGETMTFGDARNTVRDMLDTGTEGVSRGLLGPASLFLNKQQLQTPIASPEVMKYAMIYPKVADIAAEAFPDSQAAKYPKAVTDAMANTASGFTSPQNIGLLGLAPESQVAQRLVAGTFLGQSIVGTPEQWEAFKEARAVPDKIRIATEMGLSLALPGMALAHSRAGEVPKSPENLPRVEPELERQGTTEAPQAPDSSVTASRPVPQESVPSETAIVRDVPEVPLPESKPPQVEPSTPDVSASPNPEPQGAKDATGRMEPEESSTVRLYHGATKGIGQAGSDFTTSLQYAQGYADKAVGGGEVWYVDVPKGLLKTHDEYGQPMTRVIVPDEIADKAKPLKAPSVQEAPLASTQGEFSPKANETGGDISEPIRAKPEESVPEPTSTKNAVTNAEREARNIAPAIEAAKRDFGTVWDEAEKAATADPTAPERLATEIAANPRALSDKENALLLRRQIEVQNEHDAAIKAVNEAPDEVSRMDASARLERARDNLQTVYDAAKSAGTETGRGLNARKMLANDDYSLAKMEATTRAVVNNGKALTERQAADVKALHEQIRAAEEKLSAYEAREDFEKALAAAKKEAKQAGFKPQSFLEQQAQRARERIIARRGKLHADPIGITQVAHLADEAIIGASHIARGVTKFADWSAQMIADFGERIKPHLQALYAKARELHSKAGNRTLLTEAERQQRGLEGDKKRILGNIEKIQKKTEAGDFTKPEKRPPRMDREKANLLFEYQKAKETYHRRLFEAQLERQSVARKSVRFVGEIMNTKRALMTSFDLSAVLRQGGFITLGHPIRALRAFPAMFRAFASEKAQFRVNEEIKARSNAPLYAQSKLYLADTATNVSLSKLEEQYMSRWAGKIPLVAGSQRAYVTFLNKLRADSFDAMTETLSRRGKATPEEAKAIANFVNVATGRGDMGAHAQGAAFLNTVFFAPRLVLSRFQLLAGQPLYRGSGRTRYLVAKEYGRFLAGAAVVYSLGVSAGAKIELDPRSADFLKLQFGNTRIDPLFGLIQATVFLSRMASGKTKTIGGQLAPAKSMDIIGNFARSKLAPDPGTLLDARDLWTGNKPPKGHPQTWGQLALNSFLPIAAGDVYKAVQEHGIIKGSAMGVLSLFGMGLQTYAPETKRRSAPKTLDQAMRERRLRSIQNSLSR